MTTPPMGTHELMKRLRRHYIPPQPLPGGIFVDEVGINGRTGQRCDAVYVGFTSASGRIMVGHEVKVSRADWLNELKKVGKADYWHDACHAWYLVVNSLDIIKPGELPDGWGLMVPSSRTTTRLDIATKARVKERHDPPWEAVRSLIAADDTRRHGERNAAHAEGVKVGREGFDAAVEEQVRARENRNTRQAEANEGASRKLSVLQRHLGLSLVDDGQRAYRYSWDQRQGRPVPVTEAELQYLGTTLRGVLQQQDIRASVVDSVSNPLNQIRGFAKELEDLIKRMETP